MSFRGSPFSISSIPFWLFAIVLFSSISLGLSTIVRAQPQSISLNQKRVDLADLIRQVGEATGRTILFDDSVRGSVSIVAKRPVTVDEAWSMLGSSLALRGFSILPSTVGNWRVAKIADATGESPFVENANGDSDAFVTTLIPLRVASPETVMKVLEPLSGASVTLVPFKGTNSLIASGPERRIARLTTIADALDHVDEKPIHFRVFRYRGVDEIVERIEALFRVGVFSASELEVWSDLRTNSLIYRASEKAAARLVELTDRFDRPIEGAGRIRVLKVLNRDANEVAELIRGLRDTDALSSAPTFGVFRRTFSELSRSDFTIAVDEPTRSLIVRAEARIQNRIRQLLEQLDEPPQLIAVDLRVTEVRTPRSFSLGYAFSVPISAGDSTGEVIARLVSTPVGTGFAAAAGPETTIFSRVDQDLNVPFTLDDGTGVAIPIANTGVINAGQFEARTEVLIAPSLVLTAGDSHEIFVGNNVPIPVSNTQPTLNSNAAGNGIASLAQTTNFERRDIGIKIGIEAKASRSGQIVLDLDVEVSQLTASLAGDIAQVGPTFVEEKIRVSARLNDGEVAIVAMNRQKRTTRSTAGTPFLSSIPFIGAFFTQARERDEDVRLILAVKVRRISTPAELVADTIRRRLAFERRNARQGSIPLATGDEPGFAVLVTTRGRLDDAEAIAQSLDLRGYRTRIYPWMLREREVFDVYVTSFDSMSAAAAVASALNAEGWEADLTLLPTRS